MTVTTEQLQTVNNNADRQAEDAFEAAADKWDTLVPRQENFPIPTSDSYSTPKIMDGERPAATAAQLAEDEFRSKQEQPKA